MMQPVIFDFNGTMFLDSDKNEAAWCQMIKEAVGYELTADGKAKQILNPAALAPTLDDPDSGWLNKGYITLTPLRFEFTDHDGMKNLEAMAAAGETA